MMTKLGRWGKVPADPTAQAFNRVMTTPRALTVRWVFTRRFYQRQPDRQAGLKGSFRGVRISVVLLSAAERNPKLQPPNPKLQRSSKTQTPKPKKRMHRQTPRRSVFEL